MVMERDPLQSDDRRWLARELHDSVVQKLTTMLVEMELFKREQRGQLPIAEHLDHFQAATRGALSSLRQTLYQLRDESPQAEGFVEWLERGAADVGERSGIEVRVTVRRRPETLSAHATYNLSRVVEEALRNVIRHSRARHVAITVDVVDSNLVLAIQDDGDGCASVTGEVKPGLGIIGMLERAIILGGRLTVRPLAGHGTLVHAQFPMGGLA